ncbi:phage portal protein [Palleronia sp. KMU-117]|uniref:phage portal protein n=1 Tax=Palleronia sp. KMU-117 TaxID=3434108 RepID=UPI003D70D9FF
MRNFFTRLTGSARTKSLGGVNLVETTSFTGFDHYQDAATLKTYKESLYLFIAVSKITKRGASVPFELYRVTNAQGDTEELLEHPVIDLFNNPNPLMTKREFFEVSLAHYLLSGDCFWYLVREGRSIVGMVPLRPDYVEILLSSDRQRVIGYEYNNVEKIRIAPEDIVHTKNVDPTNMLRGVGASRPASQRIVSEKEAAALQGKFFKSNGVPSVLVFLNQDLNQEQVREARSNWRETFTRLGEQVGFFGQNTKDVKPLSVTPREMDFIASQDKLRNDILAAFGVPLPMVDLKDVERANSREAYRMFLQEAVIPALDAFEDTINNRMLPRIDDSVFLTFPDPTPFDREQALKEATELKRAGIISANEARALFNYEPMDGHDELTVQRNPLDMTDTTKALRAKAKQVLRSRPLLVKRIKATEALTKALSTGPKRQMNSVFATKALKETYAKAYNDRVDRKAKVLEEALNKYHEGQRERILKTDLTPNGFMDKGEEQRLAKEALRPVLVKLYEEGGQAALDALFKKADDRFFTDEALLAQLDLRLEFFVNSMTETTFEILKGRIVEGLSAGNGVAEIADKISNYFADMKEGRAMTIARTETGFALSKATNDAYQQSGIVTGKEWITVGDEKVRPEHVENDGVIVPKGAAFPNGEHYPAEHSINCRCVLAPAV